MIYEHIFEVGVENLIEKKLEQIREELNELTKDKDAVLHKDKILELSQELDKLILESYREA